MNREDIKHLAHLSRLHLEDVEVDAYVHQFDEIIPYVDKVKEISNDGTLGQSRDDAPVNMLREDVVSSYQNPQQIVNEAPAYQDNFVKVKKILNQ